MQLLTAEDLPTYYPEAAVIDPAQVAKFLGRANSYCLGVIGGDPPPVPWDADRSNLKAIVATAFEIMAEGEVAQTDPETGNITNAAPESPYNRFDTNRNPLAAVDKMLLPYKRAYEDANAVQSDNGVIWLGGG
jgi:hypothetical protein